MDKKLLPQVISCCFITKKKKQSEDTLQVLLKRLFVNTRTFLYDVPKCCYYVVDVGGEVFIFGK